MRIMFNTATLQMGGAERVLAGMANYWAEKGWDITILTYDDGTSGSFFPLHPSIRCVPMNTAKPYAGLPAALFRNIWRTYRLRKEIISASPDCVIAFGEVNGVRCLLATRGLGIPVIVSEHSDYRDVISGKHGKIWDMLRSLTYHWADSVVVLTEWSKSCFSERIQQRTVVIPNRVPDDLPGPSPARPHENGGFPKNTIASMGRFVRQKRFDLLLKAFSLVAKENDCSLIIVGDGPLRSDLESLTRDLGLGDRVMMPGTLTDPWHLLRHARMFVLSSEFEPFGMVLVEAMACGVPVISFDCPAGPREIIRHGIDGILTTPLDVDALARDMTLLLTNDEKRARLAANGLEVMERFGREVIMSKWDRIITDIKGSRGVGSVPDAVSTIEDGKHVRNM